MKLFFSLLLINFAWARPAALITYWDHDDVANHVKELIISGGHLPAGLIKIKRQNPACQEDPDSIIHLCITPNREMKTVRINKDIVLKTFKVFNEK